MIAMTFSKSVETIVDNDMTICRGESWVVELEVEVEVKVEVEVEVEVEVARGAPVVVLVVSEEGLFLIIP